VPGEEGTGVAAGGPLLLLTHRPRYPRERWFFKKLCSTWCVPLFTHHHSPCARRREQEAMQIRLGCREQKRNQLIYLRGWRGGQADAVQLRVYALCVCAALFFFGASLGREGWLLHFNADGTIQQHNPPPPPPPPPPPAPAAAAPDDASAAIPATAVVAGGSGGSGPIRASAAVDAATWWSEGDPFDTRTQFWLLRRRPSSDSEAVVRGD